MESKIVFFTTVFSLIGFSYFKPSRIDLSEDKQKVDLRDAKDYLDSLREDNHAILDTIFSEEGLPYNEDLINTYTDGN